MRIAIVGAGHVGTTVAACLADLGQEVVAVDVDDEIVRALSVGQAPVHEPGLAELVARHAGPAGTGRLRATTDASAVADAAVTVLCLPTPAAEDGLLDTATLEAGAGAVGEALTDAEDSHTVVVKSTVLPGTTAEVVGPAVAEAAGRTIGDDLHLAVNPEFLREGAAVEDFRDPDRVVVGADDPAASAAVREIYEPVLAERDPPVVETGLREAELVKCATNAALAAKISLSNDLGNVCKELGVDAYEVVDAVALDDRIERAFLDSGLGWGGSCFPKDLGALVAVAADEGYDAPLLRAVETVNDRQPERLLGLLDAHRDVAGERVAVLGLSFKPGTDDVRNSRAIPVVEGLLARDAEVVAHDPVAAPNAREVLPEAVAYADDPVDALADARACLVVTDWPAYADLDEEFDRMATPLVLDGRRCVSRRDGITYEGLTW